LWINPNSFSPSNSCGGSFLVISENYSTTFKWHFPQFTSCNDKNAFKKNDQSKTQVRDLSWVHFNMMIPFNKPYLTGKEAHYLYQAVLSGKISGMEFSQKSVIHFLRNAMNFRNLS